jgi:outer membrane protein TolC
MKLTIYIISIVSLLSFSVSGQYTLQNALKDAEVNAKTSNLNEISAKIASLKVDKLQKQYFPQIGISGQATYQSDVTSLPIELPNIEIESLSKDQYKAQAEIRQLIYDGGTISKAKAITETGAQLDVLNNEITLENIKEQIINTYFLILESEKQQKLIALKKEILNANLKNAVAGINNGVLLSSQAFELQAGLIEIDQQAALLNGINERLISILGILTGKELPYDLVFEEPPSPEKPNAINTNKPILQQFEVRKEMVALNQEMTNSQSMPKASLFLNAGYGRPALNFLDNTFQPYALGGIRVAWNLNNLYTKKADVQINQLEIDKINTQQGLLIDNLNIQAEKAKAEIKTLAELMRQDKEIYALREQIRKVAESQFNNGSINSSELIKAINEEATVLIRMELRKIQIKKQQQLLDLIMN